MRVCVVIVDALRKLPYSHFRPVLVLQVNNSFHLPVKSTVSLSVTQLFVVFVHVLLSHSMGQIGISTFSYLLRGLVNIYKKSKKSLDTLHPTHQPSIQKKIPENLKSN